jgi:hypothetical protein
LVFQLLTLNVTESKFSADWTGQEARATVSKLGINPVSTGTRHRLLVLGSVFAQHGAATGEQAIIPSVLHLPRLLVVQHRGHQQ